MPLLHATFTKLYTETGNAESKQLAYSFTIIVQLYFLEFLISLTGN
jgi:hypothetical protein